jgi:hypothetical protein
MRQIRQCQTVGRRFRLVPFGRLQAEADAEGGLCTGHKLLLPAGDLGVKPLRVLDRDLQRCLIGFAEEGHQPTLQGQGIMPSDDEG